MSLPLVFSFIVLPLFLFVFSSGDNKHCAKTFSCGNLQNLSYPFGTEPGCGDPDFHLNGCISTPYILRQDNVPIYLRQFWALDYDSVELLVNVTFNETICSWNISNIISGSLGYGSPYKTFEGINITKLYICDYDDANCTLQLLDSNKSSSSNCKHISNHPISIPFGSQTSHDELQKLSTNVGFLIEANVARERGEKCKSCLQNSSMNYCGYNSDHSFHCFEHDNNGGEKQQNKKAFTIGGAVGSGGIFVGIFVICVWKLTRKKRDNSDTFKKDVEYGSQSLGSVQVFSYEELRDATNSFSDKNEIGEGGFGSVYHGRLRDGREVAVKKLHQHHTGVDQFLKEVQVYTNLFHPNVVRLYGCTSPTSPEHLLVFEYVSNGTLADHLHGGRRGNKGGLSLSTRMKIALEMAEALFFLHNNDPPLYHRDVKSVNILVDQYMDAKVADFGLCRPVPVNAGYVNTAPQGTPGYVDPEYHQCFRLTDKSDVYSFGVVLVEIISGKMAIDTNRDSKDINLAIMAISKVQEGALDDLIDPALEPLMKKDRDILNCVAKLAFRCLASKRDDRPAMKEVVEILRNLYYQIDELKERKQGIDPLILSPVSVHENWHSRASTPHTSVGRCCHN